MKLVHYYSPTGRRIVVHLDTGRTRTKILTMDKPARISKIPREEERRMKDIPEDGKNNVGRFLEKVRENWLSHKVTISHEVAQLLNLESDLEGYLQEVEEKRKRVKEESHLCG